MSRDEEIAKTLVEIAERLRHLETLEPFLHPGFGVPSSIALANAEGISTLLARLDHIHAHPGLTIEPFTAHLNNPRCRARRDADWIHNATGNWLPIPFNAETYDNDGIHDNAINNTRLTCQTDGCYWIWGRGRCSLVTSTRRAIRYPPEVGASFSVP